MTGDMKHEIETRRSILNLMFPPLNWQIPLLVATKMSSIKKSSLFIPSPETYSKASIRWIGHHDQICIPYWPHALQASLISLLPHPLLDWLLFRYFLGMRTRGQRKDSRVGHPRVGRSSSELDSTKLNWVVDRWSSF